MNLREIIDREELTQDQEKLKHIKEEIKNTFKKNYDELQKEFLTLYGYKNIDTVRKVFKFLKGRA